MGVLDTMLWTHEDLPSGEHRDSLTFGNSRMVRNRYSLLPNASVEWRSTSFDAHRRNGDTSVCYAFASRSLEGRLIITLIISPMLVNRRSKLVRSKLWFSYLLSQPSPLAYCVPFLRTVKNSPATSPREPADVLIDHFGGFISDNTVHLPFEYVRPIQAPQNTSGDPVCVDIALKCSFTNLLHVQIKDVTSLDMRCLNVDIPNTAKVIDVSAGSTVGFVPSGGDVFHPGVC